MKDYDQLRVSVVVAITAASNNLDLKSLAWLDKVELDDDDGSATDVDEDDVAEAVEDEDELVAELVDDVDCVLAVHIEIEALIGVDVDPYHSEKPKIRLRTGNLVDLQKSPGHQQRTK